MGERQQQTDTPGPQVARGFQRRRSGELEAVFKRHSSFMPSPPADALPGDARFVRDRDLRAALWELDLDLREEAKECMAGLVPAANLSACAVPCVAIPSSCLATSRRPAYWSPGRNLGSDFGGESTARPLSWASSEPSSVGTPGVVAHLGGQGQGCTN